MAVEIIDVSLAESVSQLRTVYKGCPRELSIGIEIEPHDP